MTEEKKSEIIRKGVKVSIHKTDTESFYACSECLYVVDDFRKYCSNCGVILPYAGVGTSLEYVMKYRKEYMEQEGTGYEDWEE